MPLERVERHGVVYHRSPVLASLGVAHAFSTRHGGVSTGAFASMNLGNPAGDVRDDEARIEENYHRLFDAAGIGPRKRLSVHQVHGCGVALDQAGQAWSRAVEADAIVTADPSHAAAVRVADCVPILLASADGRTVAAVHAGWRGVVAGVVVEAARAMTRRGAPAVAAAIGPCIGPDAFEVGPEVVEQFAALFPSDPAAPGPPKWPVVVRRVGDKGFIDLRAAIRRQLISLGIEPAAIDLSDCCTYRDEQTYYSHRRERGVTGRMAAAIAPA